MSTLGISLGIGKYSHFHRIRKLRKKCDTSRHNIASTNRNIMRLGATPPPDARKLETIWMNAYSIHPPICKLQYSLYLLTTVSTIQKYRNHSVVVQDLCGWWLCITEI